MIVGGIDLPHDEKIDGTTAVLRMCSEFVTLAKCYLEIRNFEAATKAARIAELLQEFEDEQILNDVVWPARVKIHSEYDYPYLEGNEDTRYDP